MVLWIMVVFMMIRLQACVGSVALMLNVIMDITLNIWKTDQRGGLGSSNYKNEKMKTILITYKVFSFLQLELNKLPL